MNRNSGVFSKTLKTLFPLTLFILVSIGFFPPSLTAEERFTSPPSPLFNLGGSLQDRMRLRVSPPVVKKEENCEGDRKCLPYYRKEEPPEENREGDRKCLPYYRKEETPAVQPLSEFEAYVKGQLTSLPLDIRQFGYDLFERPASFAPVDGFPVGPDYLLGPGDELSIALWGKINAYDTFVIDSNGQIFFPDIGVLHLAGLTFGEVKSYLEKEISRYYRASEVRMNISMGRLRSIRVFVIGHAACPGSYTLSSFTSLLNAVLSSGGPTKSGTLRDIHLKRNGETIVHFDLYDFLLRGDKTQDLRLMPEDVVFIPPVGPLVGILGHVKNPAVYELKGDARLLDLIEMAGGLTALAFHGRVQVQRIQNSERITYFEGDLLNLAFNSPKNVLLQDGDIVRIFSVIEEKQAVTLSGAVGMPGEFAIQPGVTRIKDLLAQAGGLLYHAFDEGTVTRVRITQEGPKTEYIQVHLRKALEGDPAQNLLLARDDHILVPSVPGWQDSQKVEIRGEVRFPGTYAVRRGELLSSFLARVGGFSERAYLKGAIFTRKSVKTAQKENIRVIVDQLEERLISSSARAMDVTVTPESALANQKVLEQRKVLLEKLRTVEPTGRIPILLDTLDRFSGSPSDIPLEDGDLLVIPEEPAYVHIVGAVYTPGSYIHVDTMTLSDYIEKAGGVWREADKDEVYILKVDGTAVSRRQARRFLWPDGFMNRSLDPGDTLVVPEDIHKIAWLRDFRDISQILYNIAVTVGVALRIL